MPRHWELIVLSEIVTLIGERGLHLQDRDHQFEISEMLPQHVILISADLVASQGMDRCPWALLILTSHLSDRQDLVEAASVGEDEDEAEETLISVIEADVAQSMIVLPLGLGIARRLPGGEAFQDRNGKTGDRRGGKKTAGQTEMIESVMPNGLERKLFNQTGSIHV